MFDEVCSKAAEIDEFDSKLMVTVLDKFGTEPLEKILARFTTARNMKRKMKGDELPESFLGSA